MKGRRLEGSIALVTGGGRGIGRATAERFAAEGARVMIATRSRQPGEETVAAIKAAGGEASLITIDLKTHAAVHEAVETTVRTFGGLDIVVHNAASTPYGMLESLADAALDEAMDVNLKAAFWFAASAIKHLEASSRHPSILVVSSITGNRQCQSGYTAYGASKAGLNSFVRMAAVELGRRGIRVNGVEPGLTLTEKVLEKFPDEEVQKIRRIVPLGKTGETVDLANALLFLASAEAKQITGQLIVVDGGQSLVPAS